MTETQQNVELTFDGMTRTFAAAEHAAAAGQLSEFEAEFSNAMRDKLARFGRGALVSHKQHEATTKLKSKLQQLGYL